MYLYKKNFRMSLLALTASVKFRIGSSKTARNEQVCANQTFPKSFLSSCIQDGFQLCTYVAVFLYGVRWRHNRAPNLEPRFWSISYQFEEGQRRQLCIHLHAVFAVCQRTRFAQQRTKRFVVAWVGGATRFANLGRKFAKKKRKKIGRRIVPNTVETVINFTRVMGVRVTISCRYALSLMGRCFCFQFDLQRPNSAW